jgi:hypothetical protein
MGGGQGHKFSPNEYVSQLFGSSQQGARMAGASAAAGVGAGTSQSSLNAQLPGTRYSSSSSSEQGVFGGSGFGLRGVGNSRPWGVIVGAAGAAAAADDDDEDIEVDENIVAAIFGSQVPKAPSLQQQQQQQGTTVTGAVKPGPGQYTPAVARSKAAPGTGSQQQQQQGRAGVGTVPLSTPSAAAPRGFWGNAAGTPVVGSMGPPPSRQQQHPQQQQQKWGMPGGNHQQQQQQQQGTQGRGGLSGGLVGMGAVGFGSGLLGKRPAAHMSLLDDLVADDLDDL